MYYIWVEPTDYGATIRAGGVLPENATKIVHANVESVVNGMLDRITDRHNGCLAFPSIVAAEAALAQEELATCPKR